MTDSRAWFFARDGVQSGPISPKELLDAIRDKRCGPRDLVWHEGLGDWQPASTLPELADAFTPAPAAAAAPASTAADLPPVVGGPESASEPYVMAPPMPSTLEPSHAAEFPHAPAPPVPPVPPPGGPPLGYATPLPYGQVQSYNGMAVGGFVCSVVGLPLICCLMGIFSMPLCGVGLVLGIMAKNGMARSGNAQGHGLAIAAIVIGAIGLCLSGGMLVIGVIMSATRM